MALTLRQGLVHELLISISICAMELVLKPTHVQRVSILPRLVDLERTVEICLNGTIKNRLD